METGTAGIRRESGETLLRLGRFTEAAEALEAAVAENGDDEAAWRLLGGAKGSAGDTAGAVVAFERAVVLNRQSAPNRYNLAVALLEAGRPAEAASHLREALALDPSYEAARGKLHEAESEGGSASLSPPLSPDLPVDAFTPRTTPSTGSYNDTASGLGGAPPLAPPNTPPVYAPPPTLGMNYNTGADGNTPAELSGGFNWGAFVLSPFWAFSHNLQNFGIIALVLWVAGFIPGVNTVSGFAQLALGIYLGINGNRLSWLNRRWVSVPDCVACQRIWGAWALGYFALGLVAIVLAATIFAAAIGAAMRS